MRPRSTSPMVRVSHHSHCFCVFLRKISLLRAPETAPLPADLPRQRPFLSSLPYSCSPAHPRRASDRALIFIRELPASLRRYPVTEHIVVVAHLGPEATILEQSGAIGRCTVIVPRVRRVFEAVPDWNRRGRIELNVLHLTPLKRNACLEALR